MPANAGWQVANSTTAGAVRYMDVTASGSNQYKLNGQAYNGRLLTLRWDGGVTPDNCYAYPVQLKAKTVYTFRCLFGWQANGSEDNFVYTIGVNTSPDNSGRCLTRKHYNVRKADQFKLFESLMTFTAPEDGTYYLTFDNSGKIMGYVGDINVQEGLRLPPELNAGTALLILNENNKSRSFNVSGKYIYNNVEIICPDGVVADKSVLSPDEVNDGVEITVHFDGSRNINNELIELKTVDAEKTVIVLGTAYESSGLKASDAINSLYAYYKNNCLILDLNILYPADILVRLYNLQGMLIQEQAEKCISGNNIINLTTTIPQGTYFVEVITN